jgi:Ca2+-binding RTX toxin-like protein
MSKTTSLNPSFLLSSNASLPVGGQSAASAVADFNNDGEQDVIVTLASSAISSNIAVFLGSGDGSFSTAASLAAGGLNPIAIASADFDRDGNQDFVTANYGSDTVSVLLGNGTGTFRTPSTFSVGSQPRSVAVGDFNNDGKLDLVTANSDPNANSISVLLGNGNGNFREAENTKVEGIQPLSVATGDFDRDGNLDVVSADAGSNAVSILLGKGSGKFADPDSVLVGNASPVSVVTGDFNDDNKLDIATANLGSTSQNISVLFGNGKGDFKKSTILSAGGQASALIAGDFNGDRNLDLAATLSGSVSLAVLLGDGDGKFTLPVTAGVGSSPTSLSSGDFNDDGKPDFVTTSGATSNASVLLNQSSYVFLTSKKSDDSGVVDGSKEAKNSITINLQKGTLSLNRASTGVSVKGFEDVLGTQVKDSITGSDEKNSLSGNDGKDTLSGLDGNDTLSGGSGNDTLNGGAGDDRLTGGIGKDKLTGDDGKDKFIFDDGVPFDPVNSYDKITDFIRGDDKIVLDKTTFTALSGKISFASVDSADQAGSSTALITYVRSTGKLFYNQDGITAGFGSGGLFATIDKPSSANGNLIASDFSIQQ